jgi:hypothetical protein
LEAWHQPVYGPKASPSRFRVALRRSDGFTYQSPLRAWTRTSDRGRCLAFSVPPSLITSPRRNRNINLLSFAYASRPPLRYRLTLGGLTFPRNPWAFGEQVFHLLYRYSCRHYLFGFVQQSSRSAFDLGPNAPLPLDGSLRRARSFGGRLEPR